MSEVLASQAFRRRHMLATRMNNLNSRELLQLYRAGQDEAAAAIFDRYVVRLIHLARSRIGQRLKRRIDAEDVVQSAYRSFFVRARADQFRLTDSGDLWRLLASMTLNKLHGQIETHTAKKRGIDREESAEGGVIDACSLEPTAAEVIGVIEELQLVWQTLTTGEQGAVQSSLQGLSFEEIVVATGKSERTIRRLLAGARRKIEERLLAKAPVRAGRPIHVDAHASLPYSNYVLEELLGSGGMGKVYRATEKRTGRKVAIKALHKSRQHDERAVRRFVQEAQIVATLRHTNIVGVQGLGQFPGGGCFLVMDFVDGVDLEERRTRGPIALPEIIRIVKQVAGAIQYAHDQGIVHCDLKPANILLDKTGNAFVTDFGFACLLSNPSERLGIGGTSGYIAPEILCRQSSPKPTADVFALGMLIWTLSTGRPAVEFDSRGTSDDGLGALIQVCHRCLARDPRVRYQSPMELVAAIEFLGAA